MFKEKTCLILGAGASRPYLIPTSGELRDILLGEEYAEAAFTKLGWDDSDRPDPVPFFDSLLYEQKISETALKNFRGEFFKAQRVSIDSFLSYRKDEFETIGKLAIAAAILMCENERRLNGDWYQWLLERIIEDGPDFEAGKLFVITFNYDRSLERFLWRAFKHSFRLTDQQATEMTQRIEILHVYGVVGSLGASDTFPYGSVNLLRDEPILLKLAARSVNVVGPRTLPDTADRVKAIIRECNRVCFLGFGFWKQNLDILNLEAPPKQMVFASCYHLSRGIRLDVLERYGGNEKRPTINFWDVNQDVMEFLTHWGVLR